MNRETWPCERLIIEKVASLTEIETHYSINDLADMNDALDAWQEAQQEAGK